MITLKYNSATVHIGGLEIRSEGSEFAYALTSCPSLSRRGARFCTAKTEYATAAEALKAAETLARSLNKKVCKKCTEAAQVAVETAEQAATKTAQAPAPKIYERTENGTVTHVSIREAMAEVNEAMIGRVARERGVRTMSSGRTQHHIVYADGRDVRLVLVDAPAVVEVEQGPKVWTGEATRIVAVKGKRYVVGTVTARGCVAYWTERGGEAFGATRSTRAGAKPGTVGRAIWDAVSG